MQILIDQPVLAVKEELPVLYRTFLPSVARFVASRGGTLDEAKDIFHDAIVIFLETQRTQLIHDTGAYLVGIAKHLWIRKHHRDRKAVSLNDFEKTLEVPAGYFESFDQEKTLSLLSRAGEKCLQLLRLFYYDQLPPVAIAKKAGLKTAHSASVQKFKCMEKLRDEVKNNALTYEDFLE